MKTHDKSALARAINAYVSAARSGAGAGMFVIALLFSAWVWVEQGALRASCAISLLYFFLLTTLAAGRWKQVESDSKIGG